jgi:hypothetical protein
MELRATISSCSVLLFGIRLDCEFWKHFTVYAFPWFFVARVGAPVFPFRTTWYKTQEAIVPATCKLGTLYLYLQKLLQGTDTNKW